MSGKKSIDHSTMREMNLALILDTLRIHAPIARSTLSNLTGLNKVTVSSLVKELLDRELVRELGVDTSSSDIGRPAINLELNPDAGFIIGAEIGVDFLSVILTNFSAEILARRYESTRHLTSMDSILNRMVTLLRETYREVNRGHGNILGIGLGLPGLVEVSNGSLIFSPNLGWRDVPVGEILNQELNVPIFIDNEANMAALGESYFGAGMNKEYVLFISVGVGLGGGIVLHEKLLPGMSGFAGEIGHMTMQPDGYKCNCGNSGCWETLVSQRAVFRSIKEQITSGNISLLSAMTTGDLDRLTIPMVVKAADQKDEVALKALHDLGRWLGIGMANLINILNPERIVFGGILSLAHEHILPVAYEELSNRALEWSQQSCDIVIATHGKDSCVMGGIATVFRQILRQPTYWTTGSSS
ncbi:MAG: ROK family protein [Anaerolineales bacterium]|nr:ROK family protein [Anaerolineales bacterium]